MSDQDLRDEYDIDFSDLAIADEAFARHFRRGKVDFQDPAAVRQLTRSTLEKDFGLSLELPPDRLCPPVPNRVSYIRLLARLLAATARTDPSDEREHARDEKKGLDIGTGSSCIYPLLGISISPHWSFHATDIDATSISFAATNIALNQASSSITLHHTAVADPIMPLDKFGIDKLDFCCCNPPFYSSIQEMQSSLRGNDKDEPPHSVCTGSIEEMVCEGGDAGFVCRMIEESVILRTRITWYSSMLGKLSSVYTTVEKLKSCNCSNWMVNVLTGGRKTRRWVLAWSWDLHRLPTSMTRSGDVPRALWSSPTEQSLKCSVDDKQRKLLEKTLSDLDLDMRWDSADTLVVKAPGNTWSRAARRKRKGADSKRETATEMTIDSADDQGLGSSFIAIELRFHSEGLEIRWLAGREHVLFESFCGMLKRTLSGTRECRT